MSVSQKDIAEYLGIDRSTVTKVLNRDPRYSASEKTRDLIFRTAEKLGYDFTAIRRPYKREYGRVEINTEAGLQLFRPDGSLFDEGRANVLNLSVGGALLTGIHTAKMMLPLEPFRIVLKITGADTQLIGLEGECELVRISGGDTRGVPQLGVKFLNVKLRDRRRVHEFVESKLQALSAAAAERASVAAGASSRAPAPAPEPAAEGAQPGV